MMTTVISDDDDGEDGGDDGRKPRKVRPSEAFAACRWRRSAGNAWIRPRHEGCRAWLCGLSLKALYSWRAHVSQRRSTCNVELQHLA